MKPEVPVNALARVALARAAADRSLADWSARQAMWRTGLLRVPFWGLLLAGFVGGAVAGRVLGRVPPRGDALRLVTAAGLLWRTVIDAVASRYAASPGPAAGASSRATQGNAPAGD